MRDDALMLSGSAQGACKSARNAEVFRSKFSQGLITGDGALPLTAPLQLLDALAQCTFVLRTQRGAGNQ